MHPSSEQPDRPAAHSVTVSEAAAGGPPDSLSSSVYDWNPNRNPQWPQHIHSNFNLDETASDSDSGSDVLYRLQTREDGPTSPTSPLAPYPPLPPTESRSRAPEFYGFVAWTSTYLLFILYLLWAFLPDDTILALGVTWYPNREWSLLIPAYGMVLVLLTYFTYFALALAGTPSFADMRTITDSKVHLPASPSHADADDVDADVDTDADVDGGHDDVDENPAGGLNPPLPPPSPPAASASDPSSGPSSSSSSDDARTQSLFNPSPPQNPKRGRARPQPNPNPKPTRSPYVAHAQPDAIPELYDIPLGMVNRVVYGARPSRPATARTQP